MLNSKDFKPNELVVDYLFEYKEAVKTTRILMKLQKLL